jgi:hypothetical protein
MARRGGPVVDRRSDRPAANRRFPLSVVAGDEQQQPIAALDRGVQRAVNSLPGPVQAHPVKVDDSIGLDGAVGQAPVPAAVKRGAWTGSRTGCRARKGFASWTRYNFHCFFSDLICVLVTR